MFSSGQESNSSDEICYSHSYNFSKSSKFQFPPPPRITLSETNSLSSLSGASSNESVHSCETLLKKTRKRAFFNRQPPLGIFWDIENCQVPKSKSASALVQKIREMFLKRYREWEFVVVCDVKKEQAQIIQELHDSQVNVIHVSSTSKNAADEKLRQSLRRFAEVHPAPSAIVLISSDINFAADLSDLRYRKKIRVILVHNSNVADALILCANENYSFATIAENLPPQKTKTPPPCYLIISNLPQYEEKKIRNRLKLLTDNCGGRIANVSQQNGVAHIRFTNFDAAQRAQKRIQGEDVFGNKIQVVTSTPRPYTSRKMKIADTTITPPPGFNVQNNTRFNEFNQKTQESNVYDIGIWNKKQDQACSLQNKRMDKTYGSSDFSDEGIVPYETGKEHPVDLIISNLDSTMDKRDLRRQLSNLFSEFVLVMSLNIFANSDGSPIANIKVNSHQAAQFAISQLHKRKLGNKRIEISYAQENSPDMGQLKAMIIALLQEVPDKCMPLFKFVELFEARYNYFVPVSELKKFKDICHITDDYIPRMITLRQEIKSLPTPNLSQTMLPYCPTHCMNYPKRGWLEQNCLQLPNVLMPLKLFAMKLNGLLYSHLGTMHLLSFQMCYEQEYKEPLPTNDNGVPLEHLITCVPNIEITYVGPSKNIKVITYNFKPNECNEEGVLKNVPTSLAPNISLFCRQLIDLLKISEKCQILLSKFIPAYHHHFGTQCRVADYGYTKLSDLLESLPHVVQIIGDGFRKMITLTHTTQMKRFTSDLLRVLRAQPLKKISIQEFPIAFEKVMNKQFNSVDYGLCMFDDLLDEVPENTIVRENGDIVISIPKREQTDEEILRTKQFVSEVIDLLKCTPHYTILFDRFIPSYHHYFGYQCKVSDYGFTKLIDLFKAIPDVVEVKELDGMRVVSLTLSTSLKLLAKRIYQAIRNTNMCSIKLNELQHVYINEFGYPLDPFKYDCQTIDELVEKLSDCIEIIHSNAGTLLMAYELDTIPMLLIRGWALFLKPPYTKEWSVFKYEYRCKYNTSFAKNDLYELTNVFVLTKTSISLTNLFILAAELYNILIKNLYGIHFDDIEQIYHTYYGKQLKLSDYNVQSVEEFSKKFNFIFFVHQKKRIVVLHRNLHEHCVNTCEEANGLDRINDIISKWPISGENKAKLKIKAIKPDSPPTPNTIPWSPPQNELPFSINLPIVQNPVLIGDPTSLMSPCRLLFPSGFFGDLVSAPDPNELPMPDQLISKSNMSDESADSGVNSKLENSPSDSSSYDK